MVDSSEQQQHQTTPDTMLETLRCGKTHGASGIEEKTDYTKENIPRAPGSK